MVGSIASRLKILKQRLNEESQDLTTNQSRILSANGLDSSKNVTGPTGFETSQLHFVSNNQINEQPKNSQSTIDYF